MVNDSYTSTGPSSYRNQASSAFAATSYTHGAENRNFTSSAPPRKDDPAYATHTPLRSHNDPHASQPFRRYYLGPSPVSGSQAKKVAQAIKGDTEVTQPIGFAVAGRPGFVWIRAPIQDEHEDRTTDEEPIPTSASLGRPKLPRKVRSFSSAFGGEAAISPLPKLRALRRDPSQTSTRSFTSAKSNIDPQTALSPTTTHVASLGGIRRFAGDVSAELPLRRDASAMGRLEGRGGSLAEPLRSSSKLRQLSFETGAGGNISAMRRGKSEAGTVAAGSRGRYPPRLSISVDDANSSLPGWSSEASHRRSLTSGDMTLSPRPISSAGTTFARLTPSKDKTGRAADDSSTEEEATAKNGRSKRVKQGDTSAAAVPTTTYSRTPGTTATTHFDVDQLERTRLASNMASKPHSRSQSRAFTRGKGTHGRDVSRQSRFSIISGNTLDSVGTRLTEGSFGASGGFRARIMRAFKPNLRHLETPSSHHRSRQHKGAESEVQRRHWRAGVAPGKVGTSAGGTKWVGQSFEIGARLWDVLESCRSEVQRTASETPEAVRGTAISEEDERGVETMNRSRKPKSASDADTARKTSLSPAAVLSAFARDAQGNQEEKRTGRTGLTPETTGSPHKGLTNLQPCPNSDVKPASATADKQSSVWSPSATAKDLRGKMSIASIAPEALDSFDKRIEAQSGRANLSSLMTSALNYTANLPQKSKGGVLSFSDSPKISSGEQRNRVDASAGREERPSRALLAPPLFRTETSKSSQSGRSVYYTPLEVIEKAKKTANAEAFVGSGEADYFESSHLPAEGEKADLSSPPGHMTLNEALSHPDPPLAADDKFPEAVHNLLRRLSDVASSPQHITSDTASDHAVAARSTTPKLGLAARSPLFASPEGRSDASYPPSSSPHRCGGGPVNIDRINSLTASDTPLLKNQTSNASVIVHELPAQQVSVFGGMNSKKPPARKKTVKFDKGDNASRPFAVRSLSAPFLPSRLSGKRDASSPRPVGAPTSSGAGDPAPAHVVLSRSPAHDGSRHENNWSEAGEEEFITRRSILRRDRMLVRNEWTSSETVPQDVDESTIGGLAVHPGVWRQYMVVLRPGRLELWTNPTTMSRVFGHKQRLHLSFVIPLLRGSTFISVFSHVDRIFCLTFAQSLAATHVSGGGQYKMLNLRRSGTNILLFDARSISVSADWIWDLWREVGGTIPDALEVQVPMLDFRIKFPIPEEMTSVDDDDDGDKTMLRNGSQALMLQPALQSSMSLNAIQGEGFKMMSRHRIISTILRIIQQQPEWEYPLRMALEAGAKFELAWRRGTNLDWIINDQTLDGKSRFWSVMCGSILKQAKTPATLEFRLADHYPTAVMLGTGEKLVEPPGVEGFVWRVKPVSGILTRVYASTHSSHCFISRPSRSFPPDRHLAVGHCDTDDLSEDESVWLDSTSPPNRAGTPSSGLATMTAPQRLHKARDEALAALSLQVDDDIDTVATTPEEIQAQVEAFRSFEKRRQFDQISHADGYIDVKDIMIIRYLGASEDAVEAHKPDVDKPLNMPMSGFTSDTKVGDEDGTGGGPQEGNDVGGEEGLSRAADRNALRRARQFEVVMTNGRVTRFEAYSISVAKEWVARMHDLSLYWKRREKVDALELMEASGYNRNLIKKRIKEGHSLGSIMHSLSDGVVNPALLSTIWNWCAIMGCRGIIRGGQLFTKPRAFAPYQKRYYLLIAGRLLRYKLLASTRTARSRQNAGIFHRRTDTVIHLRDAYLWSGRLADDMLAHTRSEGAGSMGNFASGGAANTGGGQGRHKLPRIYADGLLSIDEDEDCTFVIRYRPQRINKPTAPHIPVGLAPPTSNRCEKSGGTSAAWTRGKPLGSAAGGGRTRDSRRVNGGTPLQQSTTDDGRRGTASVNPKTDGGGGGGDNGNENGHTSSSSGSGGFGTIPSVDDGFHKDLVLRARSKLERDLWMRCIGYEIERLAREDVGRETKIKETGETPYKGL